ASVRVVREDELYEVTFEFEDGGTLVIGSSDEGATHQPISPSGGTLIARYTPAAGDDYTSWYRATAMGIALLDARAEDGPEQLEGELYFTLARKNDEVLRFEGSFAGADVEAGSVGLVPASLSCLIRAYSSVGGERWATQSFANGISGETIALQGNISRSIGVAMFMPGDVSPGVYDIADGVISGSLRDDPYYGQAMYGMVEILDHDTEAQRVSGTFAFQGDAVEPRGGMVQFIVNMGAFDVNYRFQN
ncbi:MAG: hypothetical protein JRH11_05180, partial [Deltaproteobacteria bacterium]|nr:hypothetical protein [Deltaproteobacteria bacterium]